MTDENCETYILSQDNSTNKVKTVLINANIAREVVLYINDTDTKWDNFRTQELMQVVLADLTSQTMFTENDTHDIGDSSLKLPFLTMSLNNKLFGNDNFEA